MADLKDPETAEQIHALAADADIVVEGYRPGVMDRLGFGYQTLASTNPRLIYVSVTGYGQTGQSAAKPGHDINYLAAAGVLALSGSDPAQPAHNAAVPLADLCGSIYALSGVLAALFQRSTTGRGQHLDVALADCAMHWMNPRLGDFDEAGLDTLEAQRNQILVKPAYGVFETSDGGLVAIAALEDHFWAKLVTALEIPAQGRDRAAERIKDTRAINATIAARVKQFGTDSLLLLLEDADVPASRVILPSKLRSSPQVTERGLALAHEESSFIRFPVLFGGA